MKTIVKVQLLPSKRLLITLENKEIRFLYSQNLKGYQIKKKETREMKKEDSKDFRKNQLSKTKSKRFRLLTH